MTNWLVTGGGGFVGGHVLAQLSQWPSDRIGQVLSPRRRDLDLTSSEAVAHYLQRHEIRGIVHLAASLDRAQTDDAAARQWGDTFEAGRVLLDQAAVTGVRHVIVAGSIEELGDHEGELDTDRTPRPQSLYGVCKTLLREYAEYTARRFDVRVDWFRPFVVYGPGQRGDMLIPSAFRAAASGVPCDFTDGLQRRDFLYVEDLARWVARTVASVVADTGFQLHHLGTGRAVAVRDALELIHGHFPGAQFRLGARARRAGEPMLQQAPVYRDQEPGGWAPQVDLQEGLRRTAAWWRDTTNS